jgi:hypothetical protein
MVLRRCKYCQSYWKLGTKQSHYITKKPRFQFSLFFWFCRCNKYIHCMLLLRLGFFQLCKKCNLSCPYIAVKNDTGFGSRNEHNLNTSGFRNIVFFCVLLNVERWTKSKNPVIRNLTVAHIVTCKVFAWLIIMDSGFDDWVYWHFLQLQLIIKVHTLNS